MTTQVPTSATYVEPIDRERTELTVLAVGIAESDRAAMTEALDRRVAVARSVEAATAAEALDRVGSDDVDCVVSGDDLPETTGMDLFGELQAVEGSYPFVLRPTEGSEALAAEAVNAGVDGYFPAGDRSSDDFDRLAERVETVVDERRTREKLGETCRLLLRLTEYTHDALWMFTGDWTETVVANSAYEDVWGRSMDDLIADPGDFLEGIHPDDRASVTDGMETLATGEQADVEFRTRSDGDVQWLSVHAEPVFDDDGGIEYVAGYTRDVTELKKRALGMQSLNGATTTLLEARDRREVAEIVVDIAESDVGCPLTVVRTHDEDRSELVPHAATEAVVESANAADVSDLRVLSPGNTIYDAFQRGETRLFEAEDRLAGMTPSTDDIGSLLVIPLGTHGVMTVGSLVESDLDEFERNLLEILGRTATAALNRVERDRALESYRTELEQSNENLQQFAHTASHDLQEPLRMVSSYVDLLDVEYGDELDGEAAQYMEFAVDGANRMQDMIDALLQYARVQTRAQEFEETDPNDVVDRTLDALQLRISDTDATVSTDSLPAVRADPDQLGQVFQNLLKNAMTYAAESGVDPRLEIGVTTEDGQVTFEVSDNGPGIPADDREDVFEIFERNGSHDAEGTGIGLAVCQRIVRRHGGEIWVEPDEGTGATFRFTVPAAGTEVVADD